MSTLPASMESEDREEGEIIDDEDVFEDISDNTISDIEEMLPAGKCVLYNDRLRALSLSSVSDIEDDTSSFKNHHYSHKTRRRIRSRSEKRNAYLRRKRSSDYSSDESDSIRLNKRLKRQLQEAVRIDGSHNNELHHNSLRARLQGMVKLNISHDHPVKSNNEAPVEDLPPASISEVKDPPKENDDVDRELQELRLEALKTAIVNKHKHRRKRAVQDSEDVMSDSSHKSGLSENKENSAIVNNVDIDHSEKDVGKDAITNNACHATDMEKNIKNEPPSPVEEDENVLRAMVLASITDRVSNKTKEAINNIDKNTTDKNIIQNKVIEIKAADTSSALQVKVETATITTTVDPQKKSKDLEQKEIVDKCKIVTKSKIVRKTTNSSSIQQHSVALNKNHIVNNINNMKSLYQKNNLKTIRKSSFPQNKVAIIPPVKPLIISVGSSDSDEDPPDQDPEKTEDCDKKSCDIPKNQSHSDGTNANTCVSAEKSNVHISAENEVPVDIQQSVDTFLKQERAKVEAQFANTTVTDTPKSQSKPEILPKSSVKWLPKAKQLEYNALLRKLQIAEKKPRVRRNSARLVDVTKPIGIKKVTRNKIVNPKVLFPNKPINETINNNQLQKSAVEKQMKPDNQESIQVSNINNNQLLQKSAVEKQIKPDNQKSIQVSKSSSVNGTLVNKQVVNDKKNNCLPSKPLVCKSQLNNDRIHNAKLKNKQNGFEVIDKSLRNATKYEPLSIGSLRVNQNVSITQSEQLETTARKQPSPLKLEKKLSNKTEFTGFKEVLRDVQYSNNGRLQIKEKYSSLSYVLAKITEVCKERKKHEMHIKRLLQELSDAKAKVEKCKDNYSKLTEELVHKKTIIDKSTKPENTMKNPLISTTEQKTLNNTEASSVNKMSPANNTSENSVNNVTNAVSKTADSNTKAPVNEEKLTSETTDKTDGVLKDHSGEKREIGCEENCKTKNHSLKSEKDETPEEESSQTEKLDKIDVGNQNDVKEPKESELPSTSPDQCMPEKRNNQAIEEKTKADSNIVLQKDSVRHYISPLGTSSRCEKVDPLAILCPYELSGSCRDPECKFTHFEKTSTKSSINESI